MIEKFIKIERKNDFPHYFSIENEYPGLNFFIKSRLSIK